jgi:glycosyltransferase involved in cell wall biosynthesis
MKVAYLVNQYPHVTHSFIRREIAALEAQGVAVERFSIRASSADLVDPADRAERERTQVLLGRGMSGLLLSLVRTALGHPVRWLKALRTAVRLGRRSERGVLRHLAYLAEACELARRLRRSGAQHLHAHFGTNSTAVALLTHLLGGPRYSFTVHGPEEFDRPENLSLGEKIAGAAFVVGISSFGRSQLFRWVSWEHWPKVVVVHCCVDRAFLAGNSAPVPDTHRLVCVGRLSEQKGQLLLLEALHEVAARGIPFEMTLVGDGPMRSILEERIRRLGLERQVRITGWVSNEAVRQEILAARGLILPSFAEGLPVVLMEALALGRPVVTTCVAGIPELVENGVCGWLIPAGSVDTLADTLVQLLQADTAWLSDMGRAGAKRVAERHDAVREAARLAALFKTVLAGANALTQPASFAPAGRLLTRPSGLAEYKQPYQEEPPQA